MKKALFLAAMLCGLSFASNAAAPKAKAAAAEKKAAVQAESVKPSRVLHLEEMTFNCPAQGFSIQCYGRTAVEALAVWEYYRSHLAC